MNRKYAGDGHLEPIDAKRLAVGHVLRYPYRDNAVPAFSDAVVLSIELRHSQDTNQRRVYDTFAEAEAEFLTLPEHKYNLVVKVARPYLYAHHGNWLQSVETYEVYGNRIFESHKVVVNSTGEYAKFVS